MREANGPQSNGFAEFLVAVQSVAERVSRGMAAVGPVVDRWTAQARETLRPVNAWLDVNGPRVVEAMLAMQKFSAEAHVENWAELDEDEWVAALALMRADDGVPLAWLPPGHVVKALVAADGHATRDQVLLGHADDITTDARRVKDAITHPGLGNVRAALDAAWEAWDAVHVMPAQALAAACVSDIIDGHLGFKKFGDLRDRMAPWRNLHPDHWRLTQFRITAVMCSLSTAIQRTDEGFPGFNRHATVHRVDPTQYTRVNCLRGLMLATSVARELQFAASEEWRTSPRLTPRRPRAELPPPDEQPEGEF